MKIFLIDYENVSAQGLEGVKKLSGDDQVHIFYSDRIKKIPFEKSIELSKSSAKIEYIETHKVAKNYLDFQLSTYLGYLVGRGQNGTFVIVSKDAGFDSVVDFWKGRNVMISRSETIAGDVEKPKKKQEPKKAQKIQKPKKKQEPKKTQEPKKKQEPKKTQEPKKKQEPKKVQKTQEPKKTGETKKKQEKKTEKRKVSEVKKSDKPRKTLDSKKLSDSKNLIDPKKEEHRQKILALDESWRKKVRNCVKDDKLSPVNYTVLYTAFATCKDKQELNNQLMKKLPREKVGDVYAHIKKAFEEYVGKTK